MNIILIGMRGSGKTTIARLLSFQLKRGYLETDGIIEEKNGGKTVAQIVEEKGWDGFRDIEKKTIEEIVKTAKDMVISSGGGVVLNEENMKNLKKDGVTVWLKASFDTIVAHIGTNNTRPRLTTAPTWVEELRIVTEKREALYKGYADIIIDTDKKTPEVIAAEVIENLKAKKYI